MSIIWFSITRVRIIIIIKTDSFREVDRIIYAVIKVQTGSINTRIISYHVSIQCGNIIYFSSTNACRPSVNSAGHLFFYLNVLFDR